jgi:hypothetical protein
VTASPLTRHSLGIFWNGEEADGIALYGYWKAEGVPRPSIRIESLGRVDYTESRLFGDGWTVWLWSVRMYSWPEPSQWANRLETVLTELIKAGAEVAWCATEGSFADPPCLFDPVVSGRGVWIARTRKGSSFGPPGLNDAFQTLTDTEMSVLRADAELADCRG